MLFKSFRRTFILIVPWKMFHRPWNYLKIFWLYPLAWSDYFYKITCTLQVLWLDNSRAGSENHTRKCFHRSCRYFIKQIPNGFPCRIKGIPNSFPRKILWFKHTRFCENSEKRQKTHTYILREPWLGNTRVWIRVSKHGNFLS